MLYYSYIAVNASKPCNKTQPFCISDVDLPTLTSGLTTNIHFPFYTTALELYAVVNIVAGNGVLAKTPVASICSGFVVQPVRQIHSELEIYSKSTSCCLRHNPHQIEGLQQIHKITCQHAVRLVQHVYNRNTNKILTFLQIQTFRTKYKYAAGHCTDRRQRIHARWSRVVTRKPS